MAQPPPSKSILHSLPVEVRMRFYPHALAVGWDNSAPNLLVAIAKQPDLFAEAKEVYLKVNANIHEGNQDSYRAIRLKDALKLRNLMLSCNTGPYQHHVHKMRGSLLLLVNSLSTISLDLTGCLAPHVRPSLGDLFYVRELANASKGLTRIAVRMHCIGESLLSPTYNEVQKEHRRQLIETVNKGLGVEGKLERAPSDGQAEEQDGLLGWMMQGRRLSFEIWVWERMDVKGAQLKVKCGLW